MARKRDDEVRNARGRRGERREADARVGGLRSPGREAGETSSARERGDERWRDGRFPSDDRSFRRRENDGADSEAPRAFEGRQMGEPYRSRGWERDDDGGYRRIDRWRGTRGYAAARFSDTSPLGAASLGRFSHDYAEGATGGLNPGAGFGVGPAEYGFFDAPWRQGPFAGKGPAGYRRSDARIEEDVCDRLTERGDVDASHIRVAVRQGEVTLQGDVHDRRTKRAAEDVVESVGGVRQIHNQLRVETHAGNVETSAGSAGPGETKKAATRRRRR